MKRAIKFRGKRVDNGEWVYGDLMCNWTTPAILSENDGCEYEVIPSSIGQFTGLKDKNGKDIYDGDSLKPDTDNEEVKSVVRWDDRYAKFVVDSYSFDIHIGEGSQEVYDNELSVCDIFDLSDMILEYTEIIGNIHE